MDTNGSQMPGQLNLRHKPWYFSDGTSASSEIYRNNTPLLPHLPYPHSLIIPSKHGDRLITPHAVPTTNTGSQISPPPGPKVHTRFRHLYIRLSVRTWLTHTCGPRHGTYPVCRAVWTVWCTVALRFRPGRGHWPIRSPRGHGTGPARRHLEVRSAEVRSGHHREGGGVRGVTD